MTTHVDAKRNNIEPAVTRNIPILYFAGPPVPHSGKDALDTPELVTYITAHLLPHLL